MRAHSDNKVNYETVISVIQKPRVFTKQKMKTVDCCDMHSTHEYFSLIEHKLSITNLSLVHSEMIPADV
jgi:hypothetical protein